MKRHFLLAALAAASLTSACTPDMGVPQPWVAVDEITGEMQPQIGLALSPVRARGSADGMLRVVTYNVEQGRDVDGLARAFAQDAELAKADLVLVQEIEDHPGEGGSRASRPSWAWATSTRPSVTPATARTAPPS
jgi:hypothetical protein